MSSGEAMHIGCLRVVLHLPGVGSLKEKRSVIKSLIATSRSRFNVSIAEIGALDMWQSSAIGIVCVANDSAHVNRVMEKLIDTLESNPAVEVGEVELEML